MSLKALFLIAILFVFVRASVPFNLFCAFNTALSTASFAFCIVSSAILSSFAIAFVSLISGAVSSALTPLASVTSCFC